jgi:hypothetical protein
MPLPSLSLPPHGILWPYKSQRKTTNSREGETGEELKKKPEGDEQTKMKSKRHALPKVSCIVV